MSSISLKNVKKAYGKEEPVIENLDLEIKDGSFTVLVGPSGCGKSTTLRMITGLETVTSGDISLTVYVSMMLHLENVIFPWYSRTMHCIRQ